MADGPFPALVEAVKQFQGDRYSQAKRWSNGWSDCSSFVGKGMKALGLNPGGSTTLTYLASSQWSDVPRAQVGAGDIAVSTSHMILVTGPDTGIGQQNSRRNVQTGTIKDLMTGTGSYKFRRYKNGSNIEFAGYTGGMTQAGVTDIPEAMLATLKWLSNTTNWMRVGMVFGGAVLIWLTIVGIGKTSVGGLLGDSAKNAGKQLQANGKKVIKNAKHAT